MEKSTNMFFFTVWLIWTYTNYKSQHFTSYLCYIISNILQTFTTRHILILPIPHQLNRESFFLTGLYNMETFCMVLLGGEYVTTYCWRPGVPTRYKVSKVRTNLRLVQNQNPQTPQTVVSTTKVS